MRSRPYRNFRIIHIIRHLYFLGGPTPFATQFRHLFPITDETYEVPIPMVALVATAVSHSFFWGGIPLGAHSEYKLYAALYEWRTGDQQTAEFSANAFLDVYHGHVNTLRHIRDKREGAFHLMMADVYTQAR